jgi:hypothetical protein
LQALVHGTLYLNNGIEDNAGIFKIHDGKVERFAMGIRNSFGLAVDPETGFLWETENGPQMYDEVNLVEEKFNGGWALFHGPSTAPDSKVMKQFLPEMIINYKDYKYSEPEFSWYGPPVSPTAIEFPNSPDFEKYLDYVFVGAFSSGTIYKFQLNADRTQFIFENKNLKDLVYHVLTEEVSNGKDIHDEGVHEHTCVLENRNENHVCGIDVTTSSVLQGVSFNTIELNMWKNSSTKTGTIWAGVVSNSWDKSNPTSNVLADFGSVEGGNTELCTKVSNDTLEQAEIPEEYRKNLEKEYSEYWCETNEVVETGTVWKNQKNMGEDFGQVRFTNLDGYTLGSSGAEEHIIVYYDEATVDGYFEISMNTEDDFDGENTCQSSRWGDKGWNNYCSKSDSGRDMNFVLSTADDYREINFVTGINGGVSDIAFNDDGMYVISIFDGMIYKISLKK